VYIYTGPRVCGDEMIIDQFIVQAESKLGLKPSARKLPECPKVFFSPRELPIPPKDAGKESIAFNC